MDFQQYSVEDFVVDESFQDYVTGTSAESARWWQAWLSDHPERQADAHQAYEIVQALCAAQPYPVPADLKYQQFSRLRRSQPTTAPPRLRSQWRGRLLLAGILTFALLAVVGWWQWPWSAASATGLARFMTADGQRRSLTLPDGSVVTLNGNSALTTAAHWTGNSPREVWLTGEAYFQVTHRASQPVSDIQAAPAHVKFVVHAGELAISVVGTQFDVNSQAGATKVVLRSGQIIVDRPAGLTRENLAMQPGDLVETSAAQPGLMRRRVQPDLYSAWTQDHLRFQNTPLREIAQLLRNSYHLQVEVSNPAILAQEITGEVPANSLEVLLPALAKALDIQVTRTGNLVRFHSSTR